LYKFELFNSKEKNENRVLHFDPLNVIKFSLFNDRIQNFLFGLCMIKMDWSKEPLNLSKLQSPAIDFVLLVPQIE
jgi:hypothetical protein